MEDTDIEQYFAQETSQIHRVTTARPKQRCMKSKKKPLASGPVDNERPKLEQMVLRRFSPAAWEAIAANQKCLKEAKLWDFLVTPFQNQDDRRIRQFLKNSNFGARSTVLVDEDRIQFTPESVSKLMNLFQGDGNIDTEVSDMREEDLIPIFEKNCRASKGFVLAKAKGIWKEWLPFVNERLLLAECGLEHMSEKGVAAAIMSWNGIQLSWGNIVFEQMKVELNKKHVKSPLKLYSAIYISNLIKSPVYLSDEPVELPPRSPHPAYGVTQLPTSTIHLTKEEQEELEEELQEPLQRRGKKRRMERSFTSPLFEVRQRPREIDTMSSGGAGPSSPSIRSNTSIPIEEMLPQIDPVANPSVTAQQGFNQAFWTEENANEETLREKLRGSVLREVQQRINIKKGEDAVIQLTGELRNRVDEVSKLKTEVENLTALNEELLAEKKKNCDEELEDAEARAKTLQLELTALNKEFHELNTRKKDISAQCTWERKEKEKLQVMIEELKRTH